MATQAVSGDARAGIDRCGAARTHRRASSVGYEQFGDMSAAAGR